MRILIVLLLSCHFVFGQAPQLDSAFTYLHDRAVQRSGAAG
jgi:hypothetical protein